MRHNKRLFGAIGIAIGVIVVLITLLIVRGLILPPLDTSMGEKDTDSAQQAKPQPAEPELTTGKTDTPADETDEEAQKLDPETLGGIAIPPANLVVSYVKGVGGFAYEVSRVSGGRQYVSLSNSELIGTKCQGDTGEFAAIIESPNESEKTTLEKTTIVEGVQYGLSIASPTCTNNTELLKQYQESFTKPFGLLKKLNP